MYDFNFFEYAENCLLIGAGIVLYLLLFDNVLYALSKQGIKITACQNWAKWCSSWKKSTYAYTIHIYSIYSKVKDIQIKANQVEQIWNMYNVFPKEVLH